MRISEADSAAQYWPNLGSQQSAIVIVPVSPLASVKCRVYDGGLSRLFKFTDLQTKLGPVSALYQIDYHFYHGKPFCKMRKPEFGTALARCCAENKCWRPQFGPELSAKCISELSFQKRHNIGNRSSATILPMLGKCWAVSSFAPGYKKSLSSKI